MKVVLLKDVRKMGSAGQIVDVSDGHAVNFLFPRKLAVAATAANLKHAELRQQQADQQKAVNAELIKSRIAALAESPVTIAKKANNKGHLYDAVDAGDIAAAAQLPEETISLEKPIKEVGTYEIAVSNGSAFGSFQLTIAAE